MHLRLRALLRSLGSLILLLLPATASAQGASCDPERTALASYLADRTTRDLVILLERLRGATEPELAPLGVQVAAVAAERKGYLLEIMRCEPDTAFELLLSDQDRALVDLIIPGQTLQPTVLEGYATIIFAEDLSTGASALFYSLLGANGVEFQMFPAHGAPEELESGMFIRVTGFVLEDQVLFLGDGSSIQILAPPDPEGTGPLRYLMVCVNFQDAFCQVEYPQIAATYAIVQDYYLENSYGVVTIDADTSIGVDLVFATQLPETPEEIRDLVVAEIESNHPSIDLTTYYALGIFFDWSQAMPPFFNRATRGQGKVPSSNPGNPPYTLAILWMGNGQQAASEFSNLHETGHTLWSAHASYIHTGKLENIVPGEDICEYGCPLSVMGAKAAGSGGMFCTAQVEGLAHWSSAHKDVVPRLVWLQPETIRTLLTGDDGSYILRPLAASTLGLAEPLQVLKIPRGDAEALYVEFRYPDPSTRDTAARLAATGIGPNGAAMLHLLPRTGNSAIIDPNWTPASSTAATSALQPASPGEPGSGGTFFDPCSGATIQLGVPVPPGGGAPAKLPVTVTFGTGCSSNHSPSLSFAAPSEQEPVPYGGDVDVVLQVENYVPPPTGITVDLLASQASLDPVLLASGLTVDANGQVHHTIPSLGSPFSTGPLTLQARLTEERPNCCTFQASTQRVILLGWQYETPPPSVAITTPPNGSSQSLPFSVAASATDPDGIAGVEFWFDPSYLDLCGATEAHDGIHPPGCKYHAFFPAFSKNFPVGSFDRGAFLLGVRTEPEYASTVSSVPPGTYSVWSRACDLTGAYAISAPRSVTVNGQVAFTVNVPVDAGAIVPPGVTVTIPATVTADPGEVGHVAFFVNGVFLGQDEVAPYSCSWLVPSSPGTSYVVRADAYGLGGRTATDSVTVRTP